MPRKPTYTLTLTGAELAALYAVMQNGVASASDDDLEAIGLDTKGRHAAARVWSKVVDAERGRRLHDRDSVGTP